MSVFMPLFHTNGVLREVVTKNHGPVSVRADAKYPGNWATWSSAIDLHALSSTIGICRVLQHAHRLKLWDVPHDFACSGMFVLACLTCCAFFTTTKETKLHEKFNVHVFFSSLCK